jgi:hypothetical protein
MSEDHLTKEDRKLISEMRKCKRIIIKEKEPKDDLPRVMSKWFADSFLDCPMKNPNEAEKGDIFVYRYKGKVVTGDIEEKLDMPSEKDSPEAEIYCEVPRTKQMETEFAIWVIINPPRLKKANYGYRSSRFIPQIRENGSWRDATSDECESWDNVPEKTRRVLYCQGILPENWEDEWQG